MERDRLTGKVIGCAIEVHRALELGLLELTYEQCLARELSLQDWLSSFKYRYQSNTMGFTKHSY